MITDLLNMAYIHTRKRDNKMRHIRAVTGHKWTGKQLEEKNF